MKQFSFSLKPSLINRIKLEKRIILPVTDEFEPKVGDLIELYDSEQLPQHVTADDLKDLEAELVIQIKRIKLVHEQPSNSRFWEFRIKVKASRNK